MLCAKLFSLLKCLRRFDVDISHAQPVCAKAKQYYACKLIADGKCHCVCFAQIAAKAAVYGQIKGCVQLRRYAYAAGAARPEGDYICLRIGAGF